MAGVWEAPRVGTAARVPHGGWHAEGHTLRVCLVADVGRTLSKRWCVWGGTRLDFLDRPQATH
eukprot:4982680-Prymnesium_polylepis.1